jgi:hypothetical protein
MQEIRITSISFNIVLIIRMFYSCENTKPNDVMIFLLKLYGEIMQNTNLNVKIATPKNRFVHIIINWFLRSAFELFLDVYLKLRMIIIIIWGILLRSKNKKQFSYIKIRGNILIKFRNKISIFCLVVSKLGIISSS